MACARDRRCLNVYLLPLTGGEPTPDPCFQDDFVCSEIYSQWAFDSSHCAVFGPVMSGTISTADWPHPEERMIARAMAHAMSWYTLTREADVMCLE